MTYRHSTACLRLTLISLVLVAAVSCTTSPTQRRQVVLYSEGQMIDQGINTYRQMQREVPASTDGQQLEFVQCVTDHIVAALTQDERGDNVWEVTLFENDQANAFALPGGKMGVYTGLLQVTENQHQLAAVMSHEVGHVLARHSNERASQSTLISLGRVAARVAGASDSTLEVLDMGTQLGLFLPFNRTQESEADQIGILLMSRAGFDPMESIRLWENMAAQGGPRPPEFMSTHPSPNTRMADLNRQMGAARALQEAALAGGLQPGCRRPELP